MIASSVVKNSRFFLPRRIGLEFLGFRAGTCVHARLVGGGGAASYVAQETAKQVCSCSASLTVPELDQSKTTVLNTLASAHSRRSYKHAIEKFIAWYCSEPRLGFNRSVVVRYRSFLEGLSLSAATIKTDDRATTPQPKFLRRQNLSDGN